MLAPALLLAGLVAAYAPPASALRSSSPECEHQATSNPAAGVVYANNWLLAGGGLPARLCLAEAYANSSRWEAAAEAWEAGAREAERIAPDQRLPALSLAATAWLRVDQPARARTALDGALAIPGLAGVARGEVLLDRAFAHAALGDDKAARADVDAALGLMPNRAAPLHLSALLAVREGQDERARRDIAEAQRLDPSPALAAEAARITAALAGTAKAR